MTSDWIPPERATPTEWAFRWVDTGAPPEGELPPPREDAVLRRRLPPRETDLLGRTQPRRLTIPSLLLSIPGAAERCRRVPARAIEEEGVEPSDGSDFALICCPCGARPVVGPAFEKCACERAYITFGGGRVLVFYLEMQIPTRS